MVAIQKSEELMNIYEKIKIVKYILENKSNIKTKRLFI